MVRPAWSTSKQKRPKYLLTTLSVSLVALATLTKTMIPKKTLMGNLAQKAKRNERIKALIVVHEHQVGAMMGALRRGKVSGPDSIINKVLEKQPT